MRAHKAVDGAHGSADRPVPTPQDVTRKAMSYAESNVTAALSTSPKLVKSKDLTEVMQHQSEFLRSQMAALQTQLKDMGAAAQDIASKAADAAARRRRRSESRAATRRRPGRCMNGGGSKDPASPI